MRGRSASGTLRALQRERHRTQSANASLSPLSSTPMLLCAGVGGPPKPRAVSRPQVACSPGMAVGEGCPRGCQGASRSGSPQAPTSPKSNRVAIFQETPLWNQQVRGSKRQRVNLSVAMRPCPSSGAPAASGLPEPVDYRGSCAPTLGFFPAGTGLPQKSRPPLASIGTPAPAPFEPSRSW